MVFAAYAPYVMTNSDMMPVIALDRTLNKCAWTPTIQSVENTKDTVPSTTTELHNPAARPSSGGTWNMSRKEQARKTASDVSTEPSRHAARCAVRST
jgi:hypothetical protein